MNDLLLSSLTDYYNNNEKNKYILKDIIEGKHKLSLRIIEWIVTQYSKYYNVYYWIDNNKNENIYNYYPNEDGHTYKKVALYLDYRAQLKSYSKFNFDSFRRHNRITFFINMEKQIKIETTVGQLNFFRWIFKNNVIEYAMQNYDDIYNKMIINNTKNKLERKKMMMTNNNDILKTHCLLYFD